MEEIAKPRHIFSPSEPLLLLMMTSSAQTLLRPRRIASVVSSRQRTMSRLVTRLPLPSLRSWWRVIMRVILSRSRETLKDGEFNHRVIGPQAVRRWKLLILILRYIWHTEGILKVLLVDGTCDPMLRWDLSISLSEISLYFPATLNENMTEKVVWGNCIVSCSKCL